MPVRVPATKIKRLTMKYVYRNGQLVNKDSLAYTGISHGPYVIRDEMEPTEQVNGQFYTSKAKFRQVGRELGLIEVGNEKFPVKRRSTEAPGYAGKLRETIQRVMEEYKSGRRPYPDQDLSRRTTPRWR